MKTIAAIYLAAYRHGETCKETGGEPSLPDSIITDCNTIAGDGEWFDADAFEVITNLATSAMRAGFNGEEPMPADMAETLFFLPYAN